MIDIETLTSQLDREGYAVIDLPNPEYAVEVREVLGKKLRATLGDASATLETYHERIDDEERHLEIHAAIMKVARERKVTRHILKGQLPFLRELFGPDIAMTCRDNVRIVRPGIESDNLGFHRDYDYGNTAYELNILVPFVGVDEYSGLSVVPKSHLLEDEELGLEQTLHPTITKDSVKHQLGFMYAPKIIRNLDMNAAIAPPLNIGQALVFLPHCVHGQIVNSGTVTRWSLDVEVCNALAPIQWDTSNGEARFEVLTESFFVKEGRRKHGELGFKYKGRFI